MSVAEIALKIIFAVRHFIIYRKTRKGEKQRLANDMGSAFTTLVEDFCTFCVANVVGSASVQLQSE